MKRKKGHILLNVSLPLGDDFETDTSHSDQANSRSCSRRTPSPLLEHVCFVDELTIRETTKKRKSKDANTCKKIENNSIFSVVLNGS